MPKTLKVTFEEKQLLIESLNRLVNILYPEDDRRRLASDLEDRIKKLAVIDEE